MTKTLTYTGHALKNTATIRRTGVNPEIIYPYIPAPELVRAVNLALLLKRPLLLMGEPGCGKTRLAQAVAYELYHDQDEQGNILQDYRDFYFEWNIKSAARAKDGLYDFDATRRLFDVQVPIGERSDKDDPKNKGNYITIQPMGRAIQQSISEHRCAVLLIDEIDKADIDFPNDLLHELDRAEFTIAETGEVIKATYPPIIFITTNAEKDLPDAFLRRCLFHYIDTPDKNTLIDILHHRFYCEAEPSTPLVDRAVKRFLEVRRQMEDKKTTIGKNISTSELIDWFEALKHYSEHEATEDTALKDLIAQLEPLEQEGALNIPYKQVLLKNRNAWMAFKDNKK